MGVAGALQVVLASCVWQILQSFAAQVRIVVKEIAKDCGALLRGWARCGATGSCEETTTSSCRSYSASPQGRSLRAALSTAWNCERSQCVRWGGCDADAWGLYRMWPRMLGKPDNSCRVVCSAT